MRLLSYRLPFFNHSCSFFPSGNSFVATGHKGYNTDYKDVNTLARLPRWKLKVFSTVIKSNSSCRAGGAQAWRSSANSQSAYSTYRKQYQVLLTLFDLGVGEKLHLGPHQVFASLKKKHKYMKQLCFFSFKLHPFTILSLIVRQWSDLDPKNML